MQRLNLFHACPVYTDINNVCIIVGRKVDYIYAAAIPTRNKGQTYIRPKCWKPADIAQN